MTISQRRMVLATTGMTPIERMTARAAGTIVSNPLLWSYMHVDPLLCLLLNLITQIKGNGKINKTISVTTLMAPEMTMNMAALMHPSG